MIVKMNKYAFMVYHKEYETFLSSLRNLGVVHIRETQPAMSDELLMQIMNERKNLNSLLRFMKGLAADQNIPSVAEISEEEGRTIVSSIENLRESKQALQTKLTALEKDLDYISIWGEFSYKTIAQLKDAGYEISFFTCPTSRYEPIWGEQYNAFLVNSFQSISYFVTVTHPGTQIDIDAERAKMPEFDMEELTSKISQVKSEIDAIDSELQNMAAQSVAKLQAYDRLLQDKFNMKNAWVQTDKVADDKLMLLEGWVPAENAKPMEEELTKQGYYFLQMEIEAEDKVPIKLRNNAFSRLYEPITKMFSLPNYSELDPTPLFAPFFMLFFGLCFGDGGYGLLVVLLSTILKKKMSEEVRPYLSLFQYLGGAAVLVGLCTGSVFGVALAEVPALSKVKDYFVSSDNLMTFSIVIGLVQIIFGKAVAAYKTKIQKGTKYSIAPFAWVFVILSLALAFGLPMLNVQIPTAMATVCYGIAAVGLVVAYLYNSPGKNIFLNFGTGLWNTYNMASGLLGDTLSYIRLFAIGLTGSILGGVFNTLAVSMTDGMNIVARVIVMAIILLLGHAINIALCTISSLVHPLRLIFVEYYKNAEFEGGGKAYEPFKKA